MKRSKAFILVEVLTGMALQTGFIIVLCTSFYLMLSFYTRTQQYLNARQKGEKVIAYVDSRIRNVGLGLGKCGSSSEVRDALKRVNKLADMRPLLTLPVGITCGDGSKTGNNQTTAGIIDGNKIKGNILTLLYVKRPLSVNMTIRTSEDLSADVQGCNVALSIDTAKIGLISPKDTFSNSEFQRGATNYTIIEAYTVLVGTGIPLFIYKTNDDGEFNLQFKGTGTTTASVYPGDELLYIKCERMFVKDQNFKFWNFSDNSWDSLKLHSNEAGILEVYFELDTSTNILDMYVLSSGGVNDAGNTQRPVSWPSDFWKTEFANYMIYVSRASWKLSNISSSFTWN